jgi:DNA polymerase
MFSVRLERPDDPQGWLREAVRLLGRGVKPDQVSWSVAGEPEDMLAALSGPLPETKTGGEPVIIPQEMRDLLDDVLLHSDPGRFQLAYRLCWRGLRQRNLPGIASDADVARAGELAKSVRRDRHKMKAFVRFRSLMADDGEVMVAWFEPEHHILAAVAPFFVRRFANMRFAIVTPEASAAWDGAALTLGPGGARADVPAQDAMERSWLAYYAAIFNPARLKPAAMKKEMPVRYWRNLPEASLIPALMREADGRVRAMQARELSPARPGCGGKGDGMAKLGMEGADVIGVAAGALASVEELKPRIDACRRCPLFADATQGVPGEGLRQADIMFVGEQPGDQEDLAGRPFVGPAGKLFDTALERVGIDRARVYVTNAVKHFKFEPRGKRRIHKKPNTSEIDACRWWLAQEIRLVRPRLIVALGATAAFGVTGVPMPVQKSRGVILPGADCPVDPRRSSALSAADEKPDFLMTVHPSFLLRLTGEEDKRREWRAFLADLRLVAERMPQPAA